MANLEKEKIMIEELKEVIIKIEQLEVEDQRQIAKMLIEEMRWETTLQNSQEKLHLLAQEALNEHKSNKTTKLTGNWNQ